MKFRMFEVGMCIKQKTDIKELVKEFDVNKKLIHGKTFVSIN